MAFPVLLDKEDSPVVLDFLVHREQLVPRVLLAYPEVLVHQVLQEKQAHLDVRVPQAFLVFKVVLVVLAQLEQQVSRFNFCRYYIGTILQAYSLF